VTAWSRRQLVQGAGAVGLGLLAGCGRWPGQAHSTPSVARIGYLDRFPNNSSAEEFHQALRELGYVEGQNLIIEARWSEGRSEQNPALVAELVRLQPDVLVTATTPPTLAARQATDTIPVVFIGVSDPVALGIVASLARPGGNVTGLSDLHLGLSGKRLELLKETLPGATRVAALWNPTNAASAREWNEMHEAARTLGVAVSSVQVRSLDDLAGVFEALVRENADALIALSDTFLTIVPDGADLIAKLRLPIMHFNRAGVLAGALMAYGPSFASLYRRGAYYVDRILKGAKPADLPVEQPREFDFIINLRWAQELGLAIPPHVLLQATEVIQ
jgi:putative tryptophan/tyrosine transport system substrate-binding protein